MKFAFEESINPKYLESYRRGTLHQDFCTTDPFKLAILKDFLNLEVIEDIWTKCQDLKTEPSRTDGIAKHVNWFWGPFSYLEGVQLFLSKDFRKFIETLLNEELVFKRSSIPQYNLFLPQSKGIPLHNDANEAIDVVMLLQLSKNWQEKCGGELNFCKKEDGKYVKFEIIPPQINTLVLFKVGLHSFHTVSDINDEWRRENLAFDWIRRDKVVV